MKLFMLTLLVGLACALTSCVTATPAVSPTPLVVLASTATQSPPTPTALPLTATSAPTVTAPPSPALSDSSPRAPTATPAASLTPAPSATLAVSATPARAFITYQDFEILPAQTTIKVGAQVIFLIKAGAAIFHQPYNFTAPNTFESPAGLGEGTSFAFTFSEVGTVTLLCGYHPNMQATLIVEP